MADHARPSTVPKGSWLVWLSSFAIGMALVNSYATALELVSVAGEHRAMHTATAGGFVFAGMAVVAHCLDRRPLATLCGALAAGLSSVVMADQVLAQPSALLDLLFLRGPGGIVMAPVTILAIGVFASLGLVIFAPGIRGLWRQAAEGVLAALLLACGVIGLLPGERAAQTLAMDLRSALIFAGLGVAFFLMVGKLRGGSLRKPIPSWMPWAAGICVGVLIVTVWVGLTTDDERWRRESKSQVRVSVIDRTRWALAQHGQDLRRLGRLLATSGPSHDLIDVYLSHVPAVQQAWILDGEGDVVLTIGPGQGLGPGAHPDIAKIVARSRDAGIMSVSGVLRKPGEGARLFVSVPLEGRNCLLVEQDLDQLIKAVLPGDGPRILSAQVTMGAESLYRSGSVLIGLQDSRQHQEFSGQISYGDQVWELSGAVRRANVVGDHAASNTLVLWIGLFLAVSTAFAVRNSEMMRQRAVSLENANSTIEDQFRSLNTVNKDLEEKAGRLTSAQQRLNRAAQEKRRVLDSLSAFLIGVDGEGFVVEWNQVSREVFGLTSDDVMGRAFSELDLPWDQDAVNDAIKEAAATGRRVLRDFFAVAGTDGSENTEARLVSFTVNSTQEAGRRGFALIGADVTERQMLQVQLHASRKLKSVGTLAAGIAHEINTPMQFVGDNVRFVADSVGTATKLMGLAPQLLARIRANEPVDELAAQIDELLAGVDLEFLSVEIPDALTETLEGIERVTSIVRAMKDFSHPGGDGVELADLNHAIQTTLQVARNEYKYVADLVTDLGELPRVECWVDDLNQVFLNLLVNGAHAIREQLGDGEERGTITITTKLDNDTVELRFSDTGCGIPEAARAKIYDQFFTTKEIGRGTGLGLAIARSVVVDRHGGTLDYETELGVGTTFIVRLPVRQQISLEETAEETPVH